MTRISSERAMKQTIKLLASSFFVLSLLSVSACSSNENDANTSKIPNGEVITVKSATPERDFSLHVVADRDDYGQKDMEFYVSAESPAELHELVKSNIGKKIRIAWVDGLISAAEELEGEKRVAGAISSVSAGESATNEEAAPVEAAPVLEFPFKAYLRCHYGNLNQAFQICLGNGSAGTTLELVNGEGSGVFTNIDVMRRRVGIENNLREIEIDLLSSFSLKVQNAAERQTLTVRIVDQATGNQVFEGSAAQYEFVAVEN